MSEIGAWLQDVKAVKTWTLKEEGLDNYNYSIKEYLKALQSGAYSIDTVAYGQENPFPSIILIISHAGNEINPGKVVGIVKEIGYSNDVPEIDKDHIYYFEGDNAAKYSDTNIWGFELKGNRDAFVCKADARNLREFIDNYLKKYLEINSNQLIKGAISHMTDAYTLLKSNKQLIMNGAPGTGKTFSARNEIADKLFGISEKADEEKEEVKKIRMDMVQFHPSYDYTDFIEGIKPDLSVGNVGYTLKNGSFKKFCRRAGVVERILTAGKNVDDATIEEFLRGEDASIKEFWKKEIRKETFNKDNIDIEKLPTFLFIIDEINRAEISKVLGEIMFCLDADYRGKKGKIATQYSSLATEESFFIDKDNDKFFIPSNVYIIGTMNDIDRSVEVFDFALRRRFAWYEVAADSVMDSVLRAMKIDTLLGMNYINYLSKIEELNNSINELLKLNRHYHLGPSYFAKIELYYDENGYKAAREKVWNNHISQILNEYVKGKRTENEIEVIENAFKAN